MAFYMMHDTLNGNLARTEQCWRPGEAPIKSAGLEALPLPLRRT